MELIKGRGLERKRTWNNNEQLLIMMNRVIIR